MNKAIKSLEELSSVTLKAKHKWRNVMVAILILFFVNLVAGYLIAFVEVPKEGGLSEAVVKITTTEGGVGTGFFVTQQYILTAAHVAGIIGNQVTINNEKGLQAEGEVIASGYTEWISFYVGQGQVKPGATPHDWALIKIVETQAEPVVLFLGSKDEATQGITVYMAGHPMGQSLTITKGVVSRIDIEEIHTDGEIDPGFSGGPMIMVEGNDAPEKGSVVGIIVSSPDGINSIRTAVPIDIVIEKCSAAGFELF